MRVDTATRRISVLREQVFQAFVEPGLLASWLPPRGMHGHLEHIDARAGGGFRMVLTYDEGEGQGKSTADSDITDTRIVALEPPSRVFWSVRFESDDPSMAGAMSMEWKLEALPEATEVTVTATDVPQGIDQDDHVAGLETSLAQLAGLFER
jgi:uncharacterized protein YndB with AHSA1/START domain